MNSARSHRSIDSSLMSPDRAVQLNVSLAGEHLPVQQRTPRRRIKSSRRSPSEYDAALSEHDSEEEAPEIKFEGEFNWDGFNEVEELTQQNTALMAQLQVADSSAAEYACFVILDPS